MNNGEAEYTVLRQEINERAKTLHHILSTASFLLFSTVAVGYFLFLFSRNLSTVESYLLFIPLVFSCLTFNYQSNQNTLEVLSFYLRDHATYKEISASWENHYGQEKQQFQLLSFLKVFPLLIPQLIPLYIVSTRGWDLSSPFHQVLIAVDLALFALVIFNFRYKLKR